MNDEIAGREKSAAQLDQGLPEAAIPHASSLGVALLGLAVIGLLLLIPHWWIWDTFIARITASAISEDKFTAWAIVATAVSALCLGMRLSTGRTSMKLSILTGAVALAATISTLSHLTGAKPKFGTGPAAHAGIAAYASLIVMAAITGACVLTCRELFRSGN